jgi:hypothetical protein
MSVEVEYMREKCELMPNFKDDFRHCAVSDADPTGSVGRFPGPTVKP